MNRFVLGLSIAAVALAASVPAAAQSKGAPASAAARPETGQRMWSVTLTVRPDQARKAADGIVRFVKDPSTGTPAILTDVLSILSAQLSSTTVEPAGGRKAGSGPAADLATSACAAAINTLGQHASVVKSGYDAIAAGLPEGKVAELKRQAQSAAGQLVTAARTAIDRARKTLPPQKTP